MNQLKTRITPYTPSNFDLTPDHYDFEMISTSKFNSYNKNYLEMDGSQQIIANIKDWNYFRKYENILELSESKQRQRWGSNFSFDNDYVRPDEIHYAVVDVYESDPDDSQG